MAERTNEPLLVSAGGIPYNKAHLDEKDAQIAEWRNAAYRCSKLFETAENARLEAERRIIELELALEAEREECAKLANSTLLQFDDIDGPRQTVVAAIRARQALEARHD